MPSSRVSTSLQPMPATSGDWQVVELPPLTKIARHAGRSVIEASLAPMLLFYLLYEHCGLKAALGGALCWQVAMISGRLLRGERVSGMLLGCLVMLLVRIGFAWATGSVLIYLLQPVVGQVLSACAFSGSAWLQRPLAAVFAKDFVPLPPALLAMPHMTTYLCRISVLFGLASLGQAVTNVLLLTHAGVGATLLVGKAAGSSLTVSAFVVAIWWFRRSMRRHRVRLVVPWRPARPSGGGGAVSCCRRWPPAPGSESGRSWEGVPRGRLCGSVSWAGCSGPGTRSSCLSPPQ